MCITVPHVKATRNKPPSRPKSHTHSLISWADRQAKWRQFHSQILAPLCSYIWRLFRGGLRSAACVAIHTHLKMMWHGKRMWIIIWNFAFLLTVLSCYIYTYIGGVRNGGMIYSTYRKKTQFFSYHVNCTHLYTYVSYSYLMYIDVDIYIPYSYFVASTIHICILWPPESGTVFCDL